MRQMLETLRAAEPETVLRETLCLVGLCIGILAVFCLPGLG